MLCCGLFVGKAKAADQIDTAKVYLSPSVTVTSTRAFERKSPVAFSELTKAEISQSFLLKDIPQLINMMPSVMSYSQSGNGVGYSNLTLRGFDQKRIAVMINGVPQNDPEDHDVYWIDFPDIASNLESIQVQRGAGMINYGAAAIAGSINLTTSSFAQTRGIRIMNGIGWQEFGSGSNKEIQATMNKQLFEISSGLIDKYAVYARISRVYSNGYRERSWSDMSSFFFSGIRFDENFSTQINVFGGPITDGLVYNGLPKSYISDYALRRKNSGDGGWRYDSTGRNTAYFYDRQKEEVEGFSQPHFEILNDWKISDSLSFKSTLFYYYGDGFYNYDATSDTSTLRLTQKYGFNPTQNPSEVFLQAYVSNKHGGWIPRFILKHGFGELTFGAEIRLHRSDHYGTIAFGTGLPDGVKNDYKVYSYNGSRDIFSIFARERLQVTDKLSISGELQVVHNRYAIDNEKAGGLYTSYNVSPTAVVTNGDKIFNQNYLFVNPRLGATLAIDDKLSFYTQIAVTSREPRMDNLYKASESIWGETPNFKYVSTSDTTGYYDFSEPLFKPETMVDFELGANYRDDKKSFNANFYWLEYFDEFVKNGRIDVMGSAVDVNAPRTRHIGIELQGSITLYKKESLAVYLDANATYSYNRIVDYDYIYKDQDTISLKDNPIACFPDIIAAAGLSCMWNGLYASLQGKFVGASRTDNFGSLLANDPRIKKILGKKYYADNTLDPYFVMNADISYTIKKMPYFESLKLHLQINNVLNELYAAGAVGKDYFPAAERNFFFALEVGL